MPSSTLSKQTNKQTSMLNGDEHLQLKEKKKKNNYQTSDFQTVRFSICVSVYMYKKKNTYINVP